ncbi:MAG: DNA-binding response regulator [Deltaproteobacteria bacterium RBG_13_49_15]|nr:MAG: DNA-binding response regulator [Deltaproteobacteria bacterium RBG_13_49_15]
MAKEKILIVDDEDDILELVRYNLEKEGFTIKCATSGEQAVKSAFQEPFDLILLDLMLPGIDGLEVAKILKTDPRTGQTPVIMLTAKGGEADVVTGLEIGAADYITKPFSPRILTARIRALFRSLKQEASDKSTHIIRGDVEIDLRKHTVHVKGAPFQLTYTEFEILVLLAKRPGWVFTRTQIVDAIRGTNYAITDRSVDVQIAGLRKKLGSLGDCIETVRGVGYRFKETS